MLITRSFKSARKVTSAVFTSSLVVGLAACGGGGDNNSNSDTTVSGSVFASAVNGANCELQDSNAQTIAGPFTTSSTGNYSVDVPNSVLSEDLILLCSGGTYTDEATGSSQTAGTLAAYVSGGSLGSSPNIHATPDSTIIHKLVTEYSKTLAAAQSSFDDAFGYEPDSSIAPRDATVTPGTNDSEDELLAGLRAAAFSQLTVDLGLGADQQFVLLDALAQDLSDDTLDGVDSVGNITISGTVDELPNDIQSQYVASLLKFHDDDTKNKTELSNAEIGILPLAKTVLTESYEVEYIPGMMDAMQGKTQFKIRLTNLSNNQTVTGATVMLMPMMNMAMHHHGTPADDTCADNGDGTYSCTVFYIMGSVMMGDESMGYWDLKVTANGEEAHFYPEVMMAMEGHDTPMATLKGLAEQDEISNMMSMPESRPYYVFNDSLSGTNNDHTFEMFIATRENMMSHPPVFNPTTLNSGDQNYELTISSMSVEVSTDPTNQASWVAADGSSGDGYWVASGITGLTNGQQGTVYVRMIINGEQKTTDGNLADGVNGYTFFTVTPGSM